MIVVDTSAIVNALVGRPVPTELLDRLSGDGDPVALHLVDVEFMRVLRRLVRDGDLDEDRAVDARHDFLNLSLSRYPHTAFLGRMWELRHSLTAYDAAFLALAEALDVPLLTCDARLARALGHEARVELFPVG